MGARDLVQRCLTIDAPLVTTSFASLGSCLYARVLGVPALATLAFEWARELDASGTPWVRALRPMPFPVGLVDGRMIQELPAVSEGQREGEGQQLQLPSGAMLEVQRLLEPASSRQGAGEQLLEKLQWRWLMPSTLGRAAARPNDEARRPKFVSEGWGPVSLVREPGATPIELPCPEDGSADAKLSDDGKTLIVYGTNDAYAGGFAMLLDPETLAVRLRIETEHPVYQISVCDRPDRVLLKISSGWVLWSAGSIRPLKLGGDNEYGSGYAGLSSDGAYIAVGRMALQIWSVDELLAAPEERHLVGLPSEFDPSGERLVSHRTLYHGRTGEVIAQLDPHPTHFLEGGPASPPYRYTRRFIVDVRAAKVRLWSTETGTELRPQIELLDTRLPHWYMLAYDDEGTVVAQFRRNRVTLHPLSPGEETRMIDLDEDAYVLALTRDGTLLALAAATFIEIRDLQGTLLRRLSWSQPVSKPSFHLSPEEMLRFSRDGQRLAYKVDEDRWRVWTIAKEAGDDAGTELEAGASPDMLADFAPPSPADWRSEGEVATIFTHKPTGTPVAFPAPGPWQFHPHEPQFAANVHAHVELRGGDR